MKHGLMAVQFNRSWARSVLAVMCAPLAGLVLFALLVNLGSWQLGRAAKSLRWRLAGSPRAAGNGTRGVLSDAPSTEAAARPADRQVRWQASFSADHYLLLDNRLHRGRAGYHVIALAESDGGLIPVGLAQQLETLPAERRQPPRPDRACRVRGRIYAEWRHDAKARATATLPATVQTLYWDNWQRSLEALSGRAVFPYEVRIQPDYPMHWWRNGRSSISRPQSISATRCSGLRWRPCS